MFIKILLVEFFLNCKLVHTVINRRIIQVRTGRKVENSNLILENKMAELNQNKKSQKPGWQDSVGKPLFYLGNKLDTTQMFTGIRQNACSKVIRKLGRKTPISWLLIKN